MKRKLIWKPKIKNLIILAIIGYIVTFAYNQQVQLRSLYSEIDYLEAKKEAYIEEKEALESKRDLMYQEDVIEKIAREELGLIKPGEKLVIIN